MPEAVRGVRTVTQDMRSRYPRQISCMGEGRHERGLAKGEGAITRKIVGRILGDDLYLRGVWIFLILSGLLLLILSDRQNYVTFVLPLSM